MSLSTDSASPTSSPTVPFTVIFSSGVTGFASSDITASSGTVTNLRSLPVVTPAFGGPDPPSPLECTAALGAACDVGNDLLFVPSQGITFDEANGVPVGTAGTDDGRFDTPQGITVDPSAGLVYVADTGNDRIQVFHANGTYHSEFGTGGPPAEQGAFGTPVDVAVDPSADRVYVIDSSHNDIEVFDRTGTHQLSIPVDTSANSTSVPAGVAVDPLSPGRVYVADTGNDRIHVFDGATGNRLSSFGGNGTGDGQLDSPSDVAVNSAGRVYVADTGNDRIQVFHANGTYHSQFDTPAYDAHGNRNAPSSIHVGPFDTVYVAHADGFAVQIFDGENRHLYSIGSYNLPGFTGASHFNTTHDVAVDPSTGLVYVTDKAAHQVRVFNPGSSHTFFGLSTPPIEPTDFTVSGGTSYTFDVANPVEQETLQVSIPAGAVSGANGGSGNLASGTVNVGIGLADHDAPSTFDGPRVSLSTPLSGPTDAVSVPFMAVFGYNVTGFDASDVSVSSGTVANLRTPQVASFDFGTGGTGDGQFQTPEGVAVNPAAGLVYVADQANARVSVFNATTGAYVSTIGTAGLGNGQFESPSGVAVDPTTGIVYVTDDGPAHRNIQAFDMDGKFRFATDNTHGSDALGQFWGVAVDPAAGRVYATDDSGNNVKVFNATTGAHITSFGSHGFAEDEQGLQSPRGIAINSEGLVYIADYDNDRIQVYRTDGTYHSQIGDGVDATGIDRGDDGQFNNPSGVAVDSHGNIYVTDNGNDRIQMLNKDHQYRSKMGLSVGNDEFAYMHGIAADPSTGLLYASEPTHDRVRVINLGNTYFFDVEDSADGGALAVRIPAGLVHGAPNGFSSFASNTVQIEIDRTPPPKSVDRALPPESVQTADAAVDISVTDVSTPPPVVVQRPTVAISSTETDPTNASPIPVIVTFDRPVTGFEMGDITISGNATAVPPLEGASPGTDYSFAMTPAGDGLITVDIAAGVATSAADPTVTNAAAPQFDITSDRTPPTAPAIATVPSSAHTGAFIVTGTAEAGSTVTLTHNDNQLTPVTLAAGHTDWSVRVTLAAGQNTFVATAADRAGNTSVQSDPVTVTGTTTAGPDPDPEPQPTPEPEPTEFSITYPGEGSHVSGQLMVTGAGATPDSAVRLEVYEHDGEYRGSISVTSDGSGKFVFGPYSNPYPLTYAVYVHDESSGDETARVTFTVGPPPPDTMTPPPDTMTPPPPPPGPPGVFAITSPTHGSTVSGSLTVTGSGATPHSTVRLEVYDAGSGAYRGSLSAVSDGFGNVRFGPYSNPHQLTYVVHMRDGSSGVETARVTFAVGTQPVTPQPPPTTPGGDPSFAVTSPAHGSTVPGSLTVTGTGATPNSTVHLEVYDAGSGAYRGSLSVTSDGSGNVTFGPYDNPHPITYTIHIRDGSNNTETARVTFTVGQ